MKIYPSDEALRDNKPDPAVKARIETITRKVAIAVALGGTYFFMIKLMFL